jgi:hypothetical protein
MSIITIYDKIQFKSCYEFYEHSMLHRLGADAALTLGNKKAVDIIVANDDGTITTIV